MQRLPFRPTELGRALGPRLALLAVVTGACSPPAGVPPVRLLERAPAAELTGAAADPALFAHPAAIGGDDGRGLFGAVRRAAGEDVDTRTAFVLPAGSRLAWRLDLPPSGELRAALAPLGSSSGAGANVRFVAELESPGGSRRTLLDRALAATPDGDWQEVAVPVGGAGAGHRLELRVEGRAGLAGAWSAPEIVSRAGRDRRPNLILVSLDTLRADRLGAYGYAANPTSPRLDAFAARGVRFDLALAQAPWTRPSHRAMLTGVYPASLGDRSPVPLARRLWRAGYRTWAVADGAQVDSRFGFDDGFESYRDASSWLRRDAPPLAPLAAGDGRSFFAFLHTYEPHAPYTDLRFLGDRRCQRIGDAFESKDWLRLKQRIRRRERWCASLHYDGDIAYTDERIGALLDRFAAAGLLDNSIVVVTSDHGEEMWDHGEWGHGRTLYDEQLRVPLLVHLPPALRSRLERRGSPLADRPAVVGEPVALVDLVPSLLELLGLPAGEPVHGRSFVPLLRGEPLPERTIFAESIWQRRVELKSLRSRGWKLVRPFPRDGALPSAAHFELFDLRADPGERTNLAEHRPTELDRLSRELDWITGGRAGALDEALPEDADRDLRERLGALGYIN